MFFEKSMHVLHNSTLLSDKEKIFEFHKNISPSIVVSATVVFEGEKMIEYQKELFVDYLSELVDTLSWEDITFQKAKVTFEKWLQDVNVKLQVFAEKMGEEQSYPIHWSIQLIYDNDYLASFIGSSGLIILRDKRLQYMLTNQVVSWALINQFSEIVEWEVRIWDTVIACGFDVETYLDKEDILTILWNAESNQKNIEDSLIEVVRVRISDEWVRYVSRLEVESSIAATQKKIRNRLDGPMKKLTELAGWIEKFQGKILYGLIGLVTLLLFYWLVQSFNKANNATFVEKQWDQVIDITIEDIQKDIAMFQKIDASSDQKIKKYNTIVQNLNILEENNKWTYDVTELRKILESEYYRWFNIVLANNDSFFKDAVYEFTQQEKNTFSEPQQVFFKESLTIVWKEWILLNAINNERRGILISAWIDKKIDTCGFNLLRNWLYCSTNSGLYNVVKSWLQPVSTTSGAFPSNIIWLDRFGSSNMYVLSADPTLTAGDVYVTRYTNQLGSQENFGESTNYALAPREDMEFASAGFSSFTIDWTFLVWSKAAKKLYQLRRLPNGTTTLESREVLLNWWDTVEQYSEETKVIASQDSRYVYLFDENNQSFTVYRSTPYKTNDAHTYDYKLEYFFRIKFWFDELEIIDLFVDEWEKSSIYILTQKWVYKMQLHEYIEQYAQLAAE